jgi:hypothetical protein
MPLNDNIRKIRIFSSNNLNLYPKKLEKEQIRPKIAEGRK